MKDKQTKRVEALKRLSQHIDGMRRREAEIRLQIKEAQSSKRNVRPKSLLESMIGSLIDPESLRIDLERIERHIERAVREAAHLQLIITTGNRKV
jgi:hypothetical protein